MRVFWILAFGLTVLTLNAWQEKIVTPPLPGDGLSHQIDSLGRQCVANQFDGATDALGAVVDGLAKFDDADTIPIGSLRQILKGSKIALTKARDKKLREMGK